jgi:hypothetical protein
MAASDNGRRESPYTYDSFTGGSEKANPTEKHFLWWCAGAYQNLLKDCPSEHTKYAGLGGVILATFVLAALSAGYAIYSVFNNPLWAIGFAFIWIDHFQFRSLPGRYHAEIWGIPSQTDLDGCAPLCPGIVNRSDDRQAPGIEGLRKGN